MQRILLFVFASLVTGALFAGVAPATAQEPPALSYPADCAIGRGCWILSHVDLDSGPAYRGHRCGPRTYAGHKGTDIALIDPAAMATNVTVRAAAAGTVLGVRDGEPDNRMDRETAFTEGKECGNGVRIDHGGGWATQYCHLKRGSIAVRAGQRIAAGAPLGAIGNSGASETPHLHFQLEKDGTVLDPFLGRSAANTETGPAACQVGAPLWTDTALAAFGEYAPSFIRHAGFAPGPLKVRDAQANPAPDTLPRNAPALIFYTTIYGVPAGSVLALRIAGPDGKVFVEDTFPMPETKARQFNFIGRKTPPGGWPAGQYTGIVALTAPEGTISRSAVVTVR
jgi:hypothetical protein